MILQLVTYIALAWGSNSALNLLYILKQKLPGIDRPLDGRKYLWGNRILGESTTILGIILSLVETAVLYVVVGALWWTAVPLLVFLGHAVGSFSKRRMGKADGAFVPFIDHGDYMIVCGIVLVLTDSISGSIAFMALCVTYIVHPVLCLVAYRLGLRKYPY